MQKYYDELFAIVQCLSSCAVWCGGKDPIKYALQVCVFLTQYGYTSFGDKISNYKREVMCENTKTPPATPGQNKP